MRRTLALPLLVLSLALPAVPARAEVYTVTLKSGDVLETAYQPQEAAFDKNIVMLLSEVGNWIGIHRDDIESVRSDTQMSGYGKVIDKNTILLGWSANDAADPSAEPAAGQGRGGDPALTAAAQALQNIYRQQQAEESYTIPQFVDPSQTAGIPSRFIGPSTTPIDSPPR